MACRSILLILFNVLLLVDGQNWAGVYRWQSSCDQSTCCCGSGMMNITQVSSTVIGVIAGANSLCPVPVIYQYLLGANSYVIYQQRPFGTVVWTLSSDSKSLTLTSANWSSSCDDGAIKNIAQHHVFSPFGFISLIWFGSMWLATTLP